MNLFRNPLSGMLASALANCPNGVEAQDMDKPRLNAHLSDEGVAATILEAIKALEAPSAQGPEGNGHDLPSCRACGYPGQDEHETCPNCSTVEPGTPPTKLNGYPVIGTARKPGYALSQNTLVVMVKRGDADYVVATWSPALKTEWMWGRYCHSFAEACATFAAELPNGEPEKE